MFIITILSSNTYYKYSHNTQGLYVQFDKT